MAETSINLTSVAGHTVTLTGENGDVGIWLEANGERTFVTASALYYHVTNKIPIRPY